MNTPGLVLDSVTCSRGGRTLFDRLDLQLAPGQWLQVQGANGAGKTSLLRLISGLLPPSAGEVRWRGEPVATQRDRWCRERLYLGHEAALKDDLDPLENLQVASLLAGWPASRAQARAALADAGLRGCERTPVRRLSQGQRRRCGLARLLLSRSAPLWVLDEPFNALDADACAWLAERLQDHLQRGGLLVLTSHQSVPLPPPEQELQL
ncbi:cytochrome c biogenesis heme-transporting ATPase CcmA [Hydrogenophaga sp. R2]|uniref:cytochrome c biogenesis heme-transporting ATPase CcmA n=1 Tax=Hydrogenophaga sp. R2 TaxID=3132827 RepID=UPI003CE7690C